MEEITQLMVRPVEGQADIFAFQVDFIPEGKAV
jgi:hypothetical protein